MTDPRTLPMLIRSIRQHWPARKLEWLMAGFMIAWGWYVLVHPEIFTDPATAALLRGLVEISAPITEYPALWWGGTCFAVGLARGIALFVNGAYTRTPMIRMFASFVSMFILTQILIGLWKSGVPNPELVVYPWLLIADLLSAYRAAIDSIHAAKQREVQQETRSARYAADLPS